MRCEGGVALHALVIRDKTGHDMKAVWAERAGGGGADAPRSLKQST